MKETVTLTRVTMLMDEDTRIFLSKAHEYTEGGEFWVWENVEDVETEIVYCDNCATIVSEERDNLSENPDVCVDCDTCQFCGEYLGVYGNGKRDAVRSPNMSLCADCYASAE